MICPKNTYASNELIFIKQPAIDLPTFLIIKIIDRHAMLLGTPA